MTTAPTHHGLRLTTGDDTPDVRPAVDGSAALARIAPASPASAKPNSGPEWLPVDEAARILGITVAQARRKCKDEWERTGEADRRSPVVGGRKVWHVRTSVDPRLVRRVVETVPETGDNAVLAEWRSASEAKRKSAMKRAKLVVAFRRWKSTPGVDVTKGYLAWAQVMEKDLGIRVGLRRMYDMDNACPTSEDLIGCAVAMLDRRGRTKAGGPGPACSKEAWSQFCKFYLDQRQLSAKLCHEMVQALAKDEGWAWPSYRRVCQLIESELTPEMIRLGREGHDAWRRHHQTPIEQDPEAWKPGECWEGDNSQLDFMIRVESDGGWRPTRAWLSMWLDRRTRRIMGWHIGAKADSTTIRTALLSALKDPSVGAPSVVWIDNGKDFCAASIGGETKHERRQRQAANRAKAKQEQAEIEEANDQAASLLGALGIEAHFAIAYNHNGKARIERSFGPVHERFCKLHESWVGNKPGMVDRLERAAKIGDKRGGEGCEMDLPTLDEIRAEFVEFVRWYNHNAEHRVDDLCDPESGERLSRESYYQRYLFAKRVVPADRLYLLEKIFTRPLTVTKHGVGLLIGRKTVHYGQSSAGGLEAFLRDRVGTDAKVFVSYDPEDLGEVSVWDESFRFLGKATMNGMHGGLADTKVRRDDLRRAMNNRKAEAAKVKQKISMATLLASDAELAARAAIERETKETESRLRAELRRQGAEAPESMPPLRLVEPSPLDDQADAARESERMRQAAGGEHLDGDDDDRIDFAALDSRLTLAEASFDGDDDDDDQIDFADITDEDGLDAPFDPEDEDEDGFVEAALNDASTADHDDDEDIWSELKGGF